MLAVAFFGLKVPTPAAMAVAVVIAAVLGAVALASRRWPVGQLIGAGIVRMEAARDRAGRDRLRILGQAGLAAWFAFLSYGRISGFVRTRVPFGLDIRIYYRGVQQWLHGGDPWSAHVVVRAHSAFYYAGSPATTVLLAPSALLSEDQFTILWFGLTVLSLIAIVRWLRLPIWWLLFPPAVEALYSGNPQLVVLMLLLAGAGRAGLLADSVSVALKVYAIVPLLGERRPRRIALALVLTLASVAVAPALWIEYVGQFGAISARLAQESRNGFSAFYYPLMAIPTAIAIVLLWRIDPRAAAWLAVPALWPSTEFHYATFALPVMTPLLAPLLAIPIQRLAPFVIILYVTWRYASEPVQHRLRTWTDLAASGRPP